MTIPALHTLDAAITLGDLKGRIGEPVLSQTCGDELLIESVASLADAAPGALSLCKIAGDKGVSLAMESGASVILVSEAFLIPSDANSAYVTVTNPARWFAKAMTCLFQGDDPPAIHATAVVEDGAKIGPGCHIGAGTFIGHSVVLGANCRIGPNSSLGVSGLAVEYDEDGLPVPYPHLGGLVIGRDASIGANCVLVRGILETTEVGDHTKIGNLVNIGHNCRIGENCWVSSGTVLCGSAVLGRNAMIGANATVKNHVQIGEGATVGVGSVVTKPVAPGRGVFGVPAKPLATMRPL